MAESNTFITCTNCSRRFAPEELSKAQLRTMRNKRAYDELLEEQRNLKGREGFYAARVKWLRGRLADLSQTSTEVQCPSCAKGTLTVESPDLEEDVEFVPEMGLVHADECKTYYFPCPGDLKVGKTLVIPSSGLCGDLHWSGGQLLVPVESPDYELWAWIMKHHERYQGITDSDLPRIRLEFAHGQSQQGRLESETRR